MRIEELQLYTSDLDAQHAFYGDLLGLTQIESGPGQRAFQAGYTRLIFHHDSQWQRFYHFAFLVPALRFAAARNWLAARCPLLSDASGQTHFHFEAWNAEAVYFADPAGNIAELIARHDLPSTPGDSFNAAQISGVNEIGVVVEDVPGMVDHLEQQYGLTPYLGRRYDDFTAVGDAEGLLIVVQTARPWLPTGQAAQVTPLQASIHTAHGLHTLRLNLDNV